MKHINHEVYLQDALEMVLAWDIPEEHFADAVNDQAKIMAGCCPEEIYLDPVDHAQTAHR